MKLGAFQLSEVIGRGGMGDVWRGRHTASGRDVAVKVRRPSPHEHARFIQAFRNEVRAVAAMDHPGIIAVFDQGTITVDEETASGGALKAGCPYMVMELASLGSLDSRRRQLRWSEIRFVLLGLLDALAYAHSGGLIHRDIKPANVLFASAQDGRPGIKLTDFGLAHTHEYLGEVSPSDARSGTPAYMAPEQFHGQWRDYGNWTDIYAVGCLGWELATGAPPHGGASFIELARAQIQDPLPEFQPATEVPGGFAGWLAHCLAKGTERRFQRCGDAAHALAGLPTSSLSEADAEAFAAEFGGDLMREGWGFATTMHLPGAGAMPALTTSAEPHVWPGLCPAPLPRDWRRHANETSGTALVGAGLEMFGVRQLRLVGRAREQDLLWAALRECVDNRCVRAVVLHGEEGLGKARLAEWVGRRADELGWANSLRATHSSHGTRRDGLGTMLARFLRCEGLAREELVARAEVICRRIGLDDPYTWASISQIIIGAPGGTGHGSRDTQVEKFATFARLLHELERTGRLRPMVVRLENVQWGADAVALAFWMAMRAPRIPVLFVLTTTDLSAPHLAELLEMDGVSTCPVPPLDPTDHLALVRDVMGLDPSLAEKVAAQTAGSPLFARQLVGHFIERGVLAPSRRGFVLRPGTSTNLPGDIDAVWLARVTAAVGVAHLGLVETAAVLGGTVSGAEWRAACEPLVAVCDDVEEALLGAGLARASDAGFEFVHAMLRESLIQSAQRDKRLRGHHAACARALRRTQTDVGDSDGPGRIGRHLAAAGLAQEAASPLLEGARNAIAAGAFDDALALLELVDQGSVSGHQALEACMARAQIHRYRAEFREAEVALEEATRRADSDGLSSVMVLLEHSKLCMLRGDIDKTRQLLLVLEALPDCDGRARGLALRLKATIELLAGDLGAARKHVTESALLLEESPQPEERIETLLLMGYVFLSEGDAPEAVRLFDRCLEWYRLTANGLMTAVAYNHRGDALRQAADLDGAERDYRMSLEISEPLRASHAAVARANLALVCLARQQYALAERYASEVFAQGNGTAEVTMTLHLVLAACSVAAGDAAGFLRNLDAADSGLGESRSLTHDTAWPAEAAGAAAAGAGRPDLAVMAYALARRLWTQGGQQRDADRIAKVLATLSAQA